MKKIVNITSDLQGFRFHIAGKLQLPMEDWMKEKKQKENEKAFTGMIKKAM